MLDNFSPSFSSLILFGMNAHFKGLEIIPLPKLESQTTMVSLSRMLAFHWLPGLLVLNYGPTFVRAQFESYKQKGSELIKSVVCT